MTVLKIAGGIVLGFVVLIVGCSALVGAGVESVESDLNETAITVQQYTSAETGEMTKADLTEEFGEPWSADEMESEAIEGIPDSDFELDCVYYNRKGDVMDTFQFCFDSDEVMESKSAF